MVLLQLLLEIIGAVGPRAWGGGSKGEGRWVQGRGAVGPRAWGGGFKGEGQWV